MSTNVYIITNFDFTIRTFSKIFFKHFYFKKIDKISQKDINRFNHEYFIKNKYSYTTQNQFISAIKLFYKKYNQFIMKTIEKKVNKITENSVTELVKGVQMAQQVIEELKEKTDWQFKGKLDIDPEYLKFKFEKETLNQRKKIKRQRRTKTRPV